MPYDDPDPTDPMTLHGIVVETDNGNACLEMTQCFIEEYVRLGFDGDRIMKLFRNPGYAGPRLSLEIFGEEQIRRMIAEEMDLRGASVARQEAASRRDHEIALPVLESSPWIG